VPATSTVTTTRGAAPEPSTRGRASATEIGRDGQLPGALDEIAEPMVIAFCGRDVDGIQRMIVPRQVLRELVLRHQRADLNARSSSSRLRRRRLARRRLWGKAIP